MEHSEFRIGLEFWCRDKRWCCTDVGTRVVVAISLEAHEFRPCVRREPKAPHLRATVFEFGLEIFPIDAALAGLVEHCQPMLKFRLLGWALVNGM